MKFTSDVVIGLEIHVELNTLSKLFCGCARESGSSNTATCPTCLGMPGSKPRLNKAAIDKALLLCHALQCTLADAMYFSRKTYFYPDMAKNYQVTQFEVPLGSKGSLELSDGTSVGINRVHVEEDPAALVHAGSMQNASHVLVDYNRSGSPLCEVVTEPDLTSPEQARDFMKQLITLLKYLGIFDTKSCIIKADANVSIKESGYVRAEIKNIGGFKDIERALLYEIARQKKVVGEGGTLVQETRGFDTDAGKTFTQRVKETEEDYGYILDPDLVKTTITDAWRTDTADLLPELPSQRRERYITKLGLSEDDARVLTQEYELAQLFEAAAKKVSPILAARWIRREYVRVINYHNLDVAEIELSTELHDALFCIFTLLDKKEITDKVAQRLMEEFGNAVAAQSTFDPAAYVKEHGLGAMNDTGALDALCAEVIAEQEKAVAEYKEGNQKSLQFLIGQVMRKSRGSANPADVIACLKKLLG